MKISKTALTKNNNPIILLETENKNFKKTILFIGVFHGDEPQGEALIKRFIKNLDETKLVNKLLFIPCLNPDGKDLNTRQNANRVDLNRNFPTQNWEVVQNPDYFGGDRPESEAETRFMAEIIEEYKPSFILSFHAPFEIVNFDGPAHIEAEKIAELCGYPSQGDIGYSTPGSFGTYAGVERNIPIITLELSETESIDDLWKRTEKVFEYCAQF
ncbi:murein peptide amidase A [bacterium]|nr:murein peptide amidase A [bacterium]